MEREYVRGNSMHWKEVYKYVYGIEPVANSDPGICGNDTALFVRNKVGGLTLYTDEILYDAITINPNWHEVKPWEKHYDPKPFDKVLAWNDDNPSDIRSDLFLYEWYIDGKTIYACANRYCDHVKPYNEEEYIERTEEI
jgi:hypothetical protein